MNQENTFVEMIKENEALIFKVTAVYGNDPDDKQDLYQEIVLQLWRSFKKFRQEAKESTWIYRIALNTAISRLRKEKKDKNTETFLVDWQAQISDDEDVLEERSKILYEQIAKLNDVEKAIVLLYLENKSHREISEITGLSESNVSTRMVRIREKLKKTITKQA